MRVSEDFTEKKQQWQFGNIGNFEKKEQKKLQRIAQVVSAGNASCYCE